MYKTYTPNLLQLDLVRHMQNMEMIESSLPKKKRGIEIPRLVLFN
jgi:hypothetical protein